MEMIYSIHICSEINFCNNSHAIHHFHELTGPFPYLTAEGHSLESLKAYFLVFVFLERKKSTFLHGDHVQIGVFICSLVPVPSGIVHTKQMSMLFTYSAIHFLGRIDFPTTKKSRKSWIHKGKNPETLASALQMYWYIALLPWNDIISFFSHQWNPPGKNPFKFLELAEFETPFLHLLRTDGARDTWTLLKRLELRQAIGTSHVFSCQM